MIEDYAARKVMMSWWGYTAQSPPVPLPSEYDAMTYVREMARVGRAVTLVEVVVTQKAYAAIGPGGGGA